MKSGSRPSGPGGRYDGRFGADWEFVPGLGDLDACNGRVGVTPEFPEGSYHYVITDAFPSIPRCWVGVPDNSFMKGPGARGGGGGDGYRGGFGRRGDDPGPRPGARSDSRSAARSGQRGGPPLAALSACSARSEGSSCRFSGRGGRSVSGSCRSIPTGEMACVPSGHSRPR